MMPLELVNHCNTLAVYQTLRFGEGTNFGPHRCTFAGWAGLMVIPVVPISTARLLCIFCPSIVSSFAFREVSGR